MEDKELDRLFRQKLDNFESVPSSQAWQQLEQQLKHKQQNSAWRYLSGIAAALLLLLGIWGAFEWAPAAGPEVPMASEQQKNLPVASTKTEREEPKEQQEFTKESKENIVTETSPALARQSVPQQAIVATSGNTVKSVNQPVKKVKPLVEEAETAIAATTTTEKLPELELEPKAIATESLAALEAVPELDLLEPEQETIIIRYNPAESSLAMAEAAPEAAETDEKQLSARKVFGFFKKVTNTGSNSLAELREAKNELLSLNRLSSPE